MQLNTHKITLKGKSISLRPLTEDDWAILFIWNNDPDILYYSEGEDVSSLNLEKVQQIYRTVSQSAFCFMVEYEGRTIGECWLQQMNLARILKKYPGKDCRRIDLMIGEKQLWGQGLGTEIIGVLTRFGFTEEKAYLIFGCDVGDHNPRSLKAFRKNGYHTDARHKCVPGGKARYNYDLVITREDYLLKV
jgi:RimJ/RimL family protein N-acetyltransferase